MSGATCTWCGEAVEYDDGFRLYEPAGERRATFCRLEHVIPWAIQGAQWEEGGSEEATPSADGVCAHCGAALAAGAIVLVRHRGEHRIPDDFCSVDHMVAWAKAGGRWQ